MERNPVFVPSRLQLTPDPPRMTPLRSNFFATDTGIDLIASPNSLSDILREMS